MCLTGNCRLIPSLHAQLRSPARALELGGGVGDGRHVPAGAQILVLVAKAAGAWGSGGAGRVGRLVGGGVRRVAHGIGAGASRSWARRWANPNPGAPQLTLVDAPAVDAVEAGACNAIRCASDQPRGRGHNSRMGAPRALQAAAAAAGQAFLETKATCTRAPNPETHVLCSTLRWRVCRWKQMQRRRRSRRRRRRTTRWLDRRRRTRSRSRAPGRRASARGGSWLRESSCT